MQKLEAENLPGHAAIHSNPHQELYTLRATMKRYVPLCPILHSCALFCILISSQRRAWSLHREKCPLLENGKQQHLEWSLAVNTGIMTRGGYGEWLLLDKVSGMAVRMKGGKKVNHKLGTKSSKFLWWAHSFSSEQQGRRERHWDGIRYTALPGQGRGKGEGKTKEDKQAPSLSHTRATASGREPDLSWSICLCFFPLRKTRKSKATKLSRPPEKLYVGDFLCYPEERFICGSVIS